MWWLLRQSVSRAARRRVPNRRRRCAHQRSTLRRGSVGARPPGPPVRPEAARVARTRATAAGAVYSFGGGESGLPLFPAAAAGACAAGARAVGGTRCLGHGTGGCCRRRAASCDAGRRPVLDTPPPGGHASIKRAAVPPTAEDGPTRTGRANTLRSRQLRDGRLPPYSVAQTITHPLTGGALLPPVA